MGDCIPAPDFIRDTDRSRSNSARGDIGNTPPAPILIVHPGGVSQQKNAC
jgi:hypothetical protein